MLPWIFLALIFFFHLSAKVTDLIMRTSAPPSLFRMAMSRFQLMNRGSGFFVNWTER